MQGAEFLPPTDPGRRRWGNIQYAGSHQAIIASANPVVKGSFPRLTPAARPSMVSPMCGISGIVSPRPIDSAVLAAMAGRLKHRGPDDEGSWIAECGLVGFGHRRLAVVDP